MSDIFIFICMEKPQSKSGSSYQVMVLGAGGVGKTALLLLFTRMRDRYYPDDYDPNFELTFTREVEVGDESCRLDLLDTTGGIGAPGTDSEIDSQSRYWAGQVPSADGFLLVYAINARRTFEELRAVHAHIVELLKAKKNGDGDHDADSTQMLPPAVVVVGSKCDLEDWREVHQDEAKELARSIGGSYIETSAKAGINVDQAFIELVHQIQLRQAAPHRKLNKTKTCLLS
jgi:GTPase SAR1 family protein